MARRCSKLLQIVFISALWMILQSSFTKAEDPKKIKQVTEDDPTGNDNLSPFRQWINAYECLQNTSTTCPSKFQLTEAGWINVTRNESKDYCKDGGCADHTKYVIMCVYLMKHDYKFNNSATLNDVNYTIRHGCKSGEFTGRTIFLHNKASKMHEGMTITFISAVAAWILINLISM